MVSEAEFRTAILPFTLRFEGGFQSLRADPGNWTGGRVGVGELVGTKFGIAAADHPHLDIRNLTLAQAVDIYWTEYCRAPGFDRLPLPLLMPVFDAGVMSGPHRAAGWLVAARRTPVLKDQIAAVSAERLAFCRSRSTWRTFGKVWGPRIAACEKRALLLAAAAPVAIPVHPEPAAAKAAISRPPARKPSAARAIPPKPALQPPASAFGQFVRVLVDALFAPIPKGAHT